VSKKQYSYLRVHAVHHYVIDGYHSEEDLKRIAGEWFMNYPYDASHAARDGSRLGGASFAYSVEEVTPEQLKELMDKHENGQTNLEYDDMPDYYKNGVGIWEHEDRSDSLEMDNTK